tara:strand:+ start:131 stop:619 length:489 start_codon:yes stop_codon:yes gene_type:complete
MKVPNLLKNQVSLWVVSIIAAAMIINYLVKSQFTSLIVLLAVGFLSTMFTKNMVITLLVAVGVTLLFRQFGGVKEGMKEGAGHAEEEKKGEKKSADEEEEDDNETETETETETEQFSTSKTMEMMKMQERLLDKAESMAPRVEKLMSQFGGKNMSGLKNMLG